MAGSEGAELLDGVRRWLAESGAEPTPARVAQALREQGRVLGDAEVLGAAARLRSELVGSGPLEPLLADPSVTDVLVSAPDRVWVDRGGGLELTPVRFADAAAVRRLAQRLAAVAGRRLDDARPWADARLPDGTRLHAVLPPVAVGCACLSLRVVRPRAFTLGELVAAGTVPPGGDRVLRALLDARLSFLVSGGTGSGKTTLLSALLGLVGPDERIVLAEDSAELRPDHPHVVRLETRPANQEGAGLVTLEDLVRQALRMRPDRLVVGEVRGPEVVHLLAALNTGHEGGCGTVHANAAADVPARLEALGTAAGLDRAALHSQVAAALSVVLHLVRDRTGRRDPRERAACAADGRWDAAGPRAAAGRVVGAGGRAGARGARGVGAAARPGSGRCTAAAPGPAGRPGAAGPGAPGRRGDRVVRGARRGGAGRAPAGRGAAAGRAGLRRTRGRTADGAGCGTVRR
ncbi:TadA family conjugal transfer-associated ATPase [Streptomyces sp. URMC 128]|uniref:TadA family conjugal transfer-associated ATPase n=1 Tax=Streptomyces sp. URMC 128 TaxID=3423404 RepID=UPI003F1D84A8